MWFAYFSVFLYSAWRCYVLCIMKLVENSLILIFPDNGLPPVQLKLMMTHYQLGSPEPAKQEFNLDGNTSFKQTYLKESYAKYRTMCQWSVSAIVVRPNYVKMLYVDVSPTHADLRWTHVIPGGFYSETCL